MQLEQEQYGIAVHLMIHVTPLLHRVSQAIPKFTDHGIIHTTNVLGYVQEIVHEYPAKFSNDEKFLLSLAAITHDIGCIGGRENHNEKTVKILEKQQFDFLKQDIGDLHFRALKEVIQGHSKAFDLEKISANPSKNLRLKAITSLFRLADACDMSGGRIKRLVLEILTDEKIVGDKKLPADSEAIWKAHLQIENILIVKTDVQPQVYDLKAADYCLKSLGEEIGPINKTLQKLGLPIFTLTANIVNDKLIEE
jgi:hypothetical protein